WDSARLSVSTSGSRASPAVSSQTSYFFSHLGGPLASSAWTTRTVIEHLTEPPKPDHEEPYSIQKALISPTIARGEGNSDWPPRTLSLVRSTRVNPRAFRPSANACVTVFPTGGPKMRLSAGLVEVRRPCQYPRRTPMRPSPTWRTSSN